MDLGIFVVGGLAKHVGPEVVARNGAAGDGFNGEAAFSGNTLAVFPAGDGGRPNTQGSGQSVLAAENFNSALDRLVFHDRI